MTYRLKPRALLTGAVVMALLATIMYDAIDSQTDPHRVWTCLFQGIVFQCHSYTLAFAATIEAWR